MTDSKIKRLMNDVIGRSCIVNNTTFTVINPNCLDTKKKWIKGTKLLEGNRYSLFSNITSFSYILEQQNPKFFSIFQLPIFAKRYRRRRYG